jgi:23S rRNA (guanosine2251-2'-O)-methyltransferase
VAVEVPLGESERFNAGPADDLIWGRHAAQAALESDRPIHRIWCTSEMRFQPRFMQLLREAKAGGVLVEEVTWARLGQLTDGAVHQGIVLQVAAADTLDLGTLIDGCKNLGEPPLLMALDGITDPHNLGAIVRSAEALGAHGLVLPQRRSAGLTGSVAKVAAGALEHLPVARVVNLNRSLETLKEEGYRVIGLAGEGSVSLAEADLEGPLVIVTGSEGSGLSMLTRKHCDQLVRIPLRGATPSLNASVATAMVLYEVARRGWMKTITGSAPAPRIVRPQLPAPAAAAPAPAQAPELEMEQDQEQEFSEELRRVGEDVNSFRASEDAVAPAAAVRALESELVAELERELEAALEAELEGQLDQALDVLEDLEDLAFTPEEQAAATALVAEVMAELGGAAPAVAPGAEPAAAEPAPQPAAELQLGLTPPAASGFSGDIQL